jgi:hypothetical protein
MVFGHVVVWNFEFWSLGFVCNLVLGIWNLPVLVIGEGFRFPAALLVAAIGLHQGLSL